MWSYHVKVLLFCFQLELYMFHPSDEEFLHLSSSFLFTNDWFKLQSVHTRQLLRQRVIHTSGPNRKGSVTKYLKKLCPKYFVLVVHHRVLTVKVLWAEGFPIGGIKFGTFTKSTAWLFSLCKGWFGAFFVKIFIIKKKRVDLCPCFWGAGFWDLCRWMLCSDNTSLHHWLHQKQKPV